MKGKPTRKVDYLVQGWEDDDCDERLEMCCRYDVMAVSYDYLKACVKLYPRPPSLVWVEEKSKVVERFHESFNRYFTIHQGNTARKMLARTYKFRECGR